MTPLPYKKHQVKGQKYSEDKKFKLLQQITFLNSVKKSTKNLYLQLCTVSSVAEGSDTCYSSQTNHKSTQCHGKKR